MDNTRPEAGDILNEYVQNEYKLSMWIPKDLGGKVIGKRGVVITNLQRESKAKQINALQPVGNSLWIAVVILGGYRNVIAAYNSISDIVEHEVDGVVLEFMINYKKPFFLYGSKKFSIIKRISADTNVRIFFPEFNPKEQPLSEALPVSLEGECVDVQRAVDKLEEEAVRYQRAQEARYGPGGYKFDDEQQNDQHKNRNNNNSSAVTREPPRLIDTRSPQRDQHNNQYNQQQQQSNNNSNGINNSASKAQRLLELVNSDKAKAPAASHDIVREERSEISADGEEVERSKVEKTCDIPSTLVGLLLSKKPKSRVTTLNIMQHMTHTIISKIINPETLDPSSIEAYEASQRRRAAIADGNDSESIDSAEVRRKAGPSRVKVVFNNQEGVDVTFRIMGFTEESVDMVIEHLRRIISGERIREVMDELRVSARKLEYKAKGRSGTHHYNNTYGDRSRYEDRPASSYGRRDHNDNYRGGGRGGLVVAAPDDYRGDRPNSAAPYVKHTTDGTIFGARGGGRGAGSSRGRADFAGGRGRDFGRESAPANEGFDPFSAGGRGGRSGRGSGRGGSRDRRDSEEHYERREGGRGRGGRGGFRNSRDVREV